MLTDLVEIEELVNAAEKMILRDMLFDAEIIEQTVRRADGGPIMGKTPQDLMTQAHYRI